MRKKDGGRVGENERLKVEERGRSEREESEKRVGGRRHIVMRRGEGERERERKGLNRIKEETHRATRRSRRDAEGGGGGGSGE